MKKLVPVDAIFVPDGAERVFKGMIYDVYQWPQPLYNGTEATFEMLKRPDTVSVICVVNDHILILDDEQPHTGSRQSFPGGRVDENDVSIEAAARREVAEETGYRFKQWRLVKVWQPHTKTEWFIYVWLAWEVEDTQPVTHDAGEKITVRQVSFEELKQLVINKSGYLGDSTSLFESLDSLDQLLALPAFQGQEVDR